MILFQAKLINLTALILSDNMIGEYGIYALTYFEFTNLTILKDANLPK